MTVSTPLTVIIADDSPEDRAEVRRLLLCGSEQRYKFIEVGTAAEAEQAVLFPQGYQPHCLILDYNLPDGIALDVLSALADPTGTTRCPVVVLTGDVARSKTGASVLRAGAQDYLGKSWMTAESLTRAVENAIERHGIVGALRRSEATLRMAFAATHAGAWSRDLETGIISWSPENYVLYHRDPALGPPGYKEWAPLVHPDDLPRVNASLAAVIAGSLPECRVEYRVCHPQHGVRWLLGICRITGDAPGKPARLHGINLDITESKLTQEALKDADRRKNEFLAMLAHELRNPLAPIRNAVYLMRGRDATGPRLAQMRDIIERQVGHLTRLVDDLLDVSRVTQGKVRLEKAVVKLSEIVHAAVELTRPMLEAKQLAFTVVIDAASASLQVEGDVTRLAQSVGNLLHNAAKYTQSDGSIELTAGQQDGEVVIAVRDTGIGIDAELLPRIFELFTQADRSIDRAQGGLGIGLSLVKSLVELHGGTVSGTSAGLGHGSTFTIRLPRYSGAPVPAAAAPLPEVEGSVEPRAVLVVEDNADIARSIGLVG